MNSINLNEMMPFVILWIPWLMAVRELYRHFIYGRMTEYLRKGSDPVDDQPTANFTTPEQHPISYRLLFVFYCCVGALVPVTTIYVIYTRTASG